MGKVLGLIKNNHEYDDVPDELKWAIPLHEPRSRLQLQRWFAERKAQAERQILPRKAAVLAS